MSRIAFDVFQLSRSVPMCILFFGLITLPKPALSSADISPADHGRFDGSEFNQSSFRDETLSRTSFRDLDPRKTLSDKSDDTVRAARGLKHKNVTKVESSGGEIRASAASAAGYSKAFASRLAPYHELTGDWVPDKIDLTSAGGFTNYPDNGSPVPYTLNGHVDPNRGRPWEEH